MTTTLDQPTTEAPTLLEKFRAGVPGIYEGIHAVDYHDLDCASASRLKKLARSPMHCRWDIEHPDDDDTEAKSLGTVGHACLLEPATFRQKYALGPDVKLNTNV